MAQMPRKPDMGGESYAETGLYRESAGDLGRKLSILNVVCPSRESQALRSMTDSPFPALGICNSFVSCGLAFLSPITWL